MEYDIAQLEQHDKIRQFFVYLRNCNIANIDCKQLKKLSYAAKNDLVLSYLKSDIIFDNITLCKQILAICKHYHKNEYEDVFMTEDEIKKFIFENLSYVENIVDFLHSAIYYCTTFINELKHMYFKAASFCMSKPFAENIYMVLKNMNAYDEYLAFISTCELKNWVLYFTHDKAEHLVQFISHSKIIAMLYGNTIGDISKLMQYVNVI